MKQSALLISLLGCLIWLNVAQAVTYQVGPGRQYTQITQVVNLLQPGDIVEVDGNATYQPVDFTRSGTASQPIIIRGMRINGNRPVISGGTWTVHFDLANFITFEGFEVTGGSEIGLRVYGADIIVRDTVVRNCPKHGILGADYSTGNLTLDHIEVYGCGSQPPGENLKHAVYIATDESSYPNAIFRLQYSYIHDNNAGETVKSRSRRNEIYYNWIQTAPGQYNYYQMSLYGPDEPVVPGIREDGDVVGNVFVGVAGNGVGSSVRLGSDGHDYSMGRYRFVNNTFITFNAAPRDFLRVFGTIESIELNNNVFYSINPVTELVNLTDGSWTNGQVISGRNNWIVQNVNGVPAGLTATLRGTNPGLTNLASVASVDPRPLTGSAVIDQGTTNTTNSNSFPIPNPLLFPQYMPAIRLASDFTSLTPTPRVTSGTNPDIGAFEFSSGGSPTPTPTPTGSACDINHDGSTNALDIQNAVNQILGTTACTTADLNGSGTCNVVDIQRIVNAALGGACVTGP